MQISRAMRVPRGITYGAVSWIPVLLLGVIGGIAFFPRVWGLTDFLTTDEAYHWIDRTRAFRHVLSQQRWHETILAGHPGVTLMWLGSLGLVLEDFFSGQGAAGSTALVERLAWMRLPVALLHTLLIPCGYLLLRRLVVPTTALIASLLWATSPYLIAHSRLLHLDALLTMFVTLSLLCTLIACRATRPLPWMIAAGMLTGLALLTKGPALILLPTIGVILLWHVPAATRPARLRRTTGWYLLWLGVAAGIVVLLWPALWVVPEQALQRYLGEIISNGGRPNGDGQFFLGQPVGDPGPWFYPVVNLFRLTPLATLGLLALPLALWRSASERRTLLALGAFLVFWTLVMTLGPKKFDRYVLPTWPALLVLVAAGLNQLLKTGQHLLIQQNWPRHTHHVLAASAGLVLAVLMLHPLLVYHPYYLSYYNPLLGGGRAAQRILLIGWGEGMDQIGAYLRARPDLQDGPVLSALPRTLQPFVPVPVKSVLELNESTQNYAVVYLESAQRRAYPEIYDQIRQTVPLDRITIHGIDYALIYQLPRPFDQPVGAAWGNPPGTVLASQPDTLRLLGITITHTPEQLTVTPAWDVRDHLAGDYNVFMHLIDAQGQRVAQVDVAPGGAAWPATSAWQPGQQISVPLPLPLPADLATGEYWLILGLYDSTTGERVPLIAGATADPHLAGADALLLDIIRL